MDFNIKNIRTIDLIKELLSRTTVYGSCEVNFGDSVKFCSVNGKSFKIVGKDSTHFTDDIRQAIDKFVELYILES